MTKCKNCNVKISDGYKKSCPNCNYTVCNDCSTKTFDICPLCYHDLEFKE